MSDLRTRFEDGDDACMFFGLHKKLIVTELERMQVHDFFVKHGVADSDSYDDEWFPLACVYENEEDHTYVVGLHAADG